jgi:hypothetical protein
LGHYDHDRLEDLIENLNGIRVCPKLAQLACTAEYKDTNERFGLIVDQVDFDAGEVNVEIVTEAEDEELSETVQAIRQQIVLEPRVEDPRLAASAEAVRKARAALKLAQVAAAELKEALDSAIDRAAIAAADRYEAAPDDAAAAERAGQASAAADAAFALHTAAARAAAVANSALNDAEKSSQEERKRAEERQRERQANIPLESKWRDDAFWAKWLTAGQLRLARHQGLHLPVLPVQTSDEKALYRELARKHTPAK